MDIEQLRNYCLSKKGVTESLPFDQDTLVFKVLDKMFALTDLAEERLRVNLKCDPAYAMELREQYPDAVRPGYHMNKKHWNTVYFDSGLPDDFLLGLIDHSYDCVVKKMKKADRKALGRS